MLPVIYLSDDVADQNAFLDDMIEKGEYLPYYVFKIEPIKTEISIDQIRAIIKELISDVPHNRLFAISTFDTASLEAQNAFLKTLEEKNEKNQFVMFVTDLGRVLPTIQSRSKLILSSTKAENKLVSLENTELFERLEKNADLSFLVSVSSMNRETAVEFFDQVILWLRQKLQNGRPQPATILKKALQQKALLVSNNLNPQLAVDSFLLYFRKIVR